MPGTELNILDSILGAYGPTVMYPSKFFVSWNTVVTLAFSGFSASLLRMKSEIEQRVPVLQQENPGSKWPKTTLGCLMDKEQLTPDEVDALRDICAEHSSSLENSKITISRLSLVFFQYRTLEKRLLTHNFELQGEQLENDNPPSWHLQQVAEVMAQFSQKRRTGNKNQSDTNDFSAGIVLQ